MLILVMLLKIPVETAHMDMLQPAPTCKSVNWDESMYSIYIYLDILCMCVSAGRKSFNQSMYCIIISFQVKSQQCFILLFLLIILIGNVDFKTSIIMMQKQVNIPRYMHIRKKLRCLVPSKRKCIDYITAYSIQILPFTVVPHQ